MPVVLLVLGLVTTVAGLVLVASGLSVRDGTFDTEVLTPGTIAIVGGLLLVGLGFVVRELQRIERALCGPAMPRVAPADVAAAVTEAPDEATPIPPLVPKVEPQKVEPQVASIGAAATSVSFEDAALERLRAALPNVKRVENGRLSEAADLSLMPPEVADLDESVAEVRNVAAVGRATHGVAAPARIVPRFDAKPRAPASPAKAKVSVFNTFWPPTPRREGQASPIQAAPPVPPPALSETPSQIQPAQSPPPLTQATAASVPVSVLKSGVVEGIAYTLYSDGSIEAQLPQGTLRFGSISALRNHIENTA
jgi:hypothetical protein